MTNAVFYIIVLIMSVVVHEVAHGYVALYLGDQTAKRMGRLTLNPIKHLDPIGSVLIPAALILSHAGFVLGWARPVPYVEANLRDKKWGTLKVSIAGALSNFAIAIIFGILLRLFAFSNSVTPAIVFIASTIIIVNIFLGIFNLIPIPPLDGSKVLFALLPHTQSSINFQRFFTKYSIFFLFFFIFFLWQFILPVVYFIYFVLTGHSLS